MTNGLMKTNGDFSIRTFVITVVSFSFKSPDEPHCPLPLEKQVVTFRRCLTETCCISMLLPMPASLERDTYSVLGLLPNHSQKSVNSGIVAIKNREPS